MSARNPVTPLVLALAALVLSCGGGGSSPSGPTTPVPSPTPVVTSRAAVSGLVFYDENANGTLDPEEQVHLPAASVTIGDRTAGSDISGQFQIPDAPAGTRQATIAPESLPPFFTAQPAGVTVPLAAGATLSLPVTLPIGSNRPNNYLCFGDSITAGDGSRNGSGYLVPLSDRLRAYWGGRPALVKDGIQSTRSDQGAARLPGSLSRYRPAYVLVEYGTNDWNEFGCRFVESCFTVASVRSMIQSAKAANTVPVIATIIPANPAYLDRQATERNAWVESMNTLIRQAVKEEGGVLADPWALFNSTGSGLKDLYTDHVHPNDDGYDLMAEAFYRAITQPRGR